MKVVSLVLCVALLAGCFAYNPSGKKWAYVGDVILIAGGGAAAAIDITQNKPPACEGGGVRITHRSAAAWSRARCWSVPVCSASSSTRRARTPKAAASRRVRRRDPSGGGERRGRCRRMRAASSRWSCRHRQNNPRCRSPRRPSVVGPRRRRFGFAIFFAAAQEAERLELETERRRRRDVELRIVGHDVEVDRARVDHRASSVGSRSSAVRAASVRRRCCSAGDRRRPIDLLACRKSQTSPRLSRCVRSVGRVVERWALTSGGDLQLERREHGRGLGGWRSSQLGCASGARLRPAERVLCATTARAARFGVPVMSAILLDRWSAGRLCRDVVPGVLRGCARARRGCCAGPAERCARGRGRA